MLTGLLATLLAVLISQETGSPRFTLSGTVVDQMNRGIAGVSMTLTDVQDQKNRRIKTDKQGRFEFNDVSDGKYELEATQIGFRSDRTMADVSGADGQRTITMQPGGLEETIKVSGRQAADGQQRFVQRQNTKLAAERCVDSGDGGVIRPPFKLVHVVPGYPPLMRDSRIEGTVVLTGQLGADGSPLNLKAIGNPNTGLTAAAMDAARQFRFSPVLLNCVPVPIEMSTTFVFSLR